MRANLALEHRVQPVLIDLELGRHHRRHPGRPVDPSVALVPGELEHLRHGGHGWLAVGDAAAAFDPLAGYGVTCALGSGYYAARALLDDWRGDPVAFPAYAKLVAKIVLESQISRNHFYS